MLKFYFCVNLSNGNLDCTLREYRKGPYSTFKTIVRADYCSLGIMLQNMNEESFKRELIINSMDRRILDRDETVTKEQAKSLRAEYREKYSQYFV